MTFEIQYSKNARFKASNMQKMNQEDKARFNLLLALKAKILKFKDLTYKIY